MVTLQDIANQLNVSVSLVSKVLNERMGNTRAKPELADEIRRVAQEMGYRKNYGAIALRAGRQDTLAVFIHRHGGAGSSLIESLLDGISEATKTNGVSQKQMIWFYRKQEEFIARRDMLHRGMVDGLIISGVRHRYLVDDLLMIHKCGVPVVTVYNEPLDAGLVNIGLDNASLTRETTRHLIERGCRRILHLAIWPERLAGYHEALDEAGIEYDAELVIQAVYDGHSELRLDNTAEMIGQAIDRGIEFDGFCAQTDHQAVAAVNELVRRGISVPGQVKVTGVDGAPFGELSIVPMTTVDQRFEERGQLAAEAIARMLDNESVESINLEPQLIERQSTAVN